MRRLGSASLVACVAVSLGMVAAPPAHAVIEKGGSLSCNSNQHVVIQSLSYGTTKHFAPTSTRLATWNVPISNPGLRTTHTNYSATSWRVTVTGGGLDDTVTKAFCAAGGPA